MRFFSTDWIISKFQTSIVKTQNVKQYQNELFFSSRWAILYIFLSKFQTSIGYLYPHSKNASFNSTYTLKISLRLSSGVPFDMTYMTAMSSLKLMVPSRFLSYMLKIRLESLSQSPPEKHLPKRDLTNKINKFESLNRTVILVKRWGDIMVYW